MRKLAWVTNHGLDGTEDLTPWFGTAGRGRVYTYPSSTLVC